MIYTVTYKTKAGVVATLKFSCKTPEWAKKTSDGVLNGLRDAEVVGKKDFVEVLPKAFPGGSNAPGAEIDPRTFLPEDDDPDVDDEDEELDGDEDECPECGLFPCDC